MDRRRLLSIRSLGTALAAGVLTTVVAACGSSTTGDSGSATSSSSAPVTVAGSVVSTAGSSNEAQIVVPDVIAAEWSALGSGNGVEWVAVAGDGTTTTAPVAVADGDAATAFAAKLNAHQAEQPGRDALAGLDAIASPAGAPVWVFSPLLDTAGALDMNQLAFDQSPPDVVTAVTAAGALPNLTGRDVNFVVTPVAGQQNALSDAQVGYQHAIWEGVATAAGASKVTFYDGTGTGAGTGTIPVVATPDPSDKISSEGSGPTRTCTLPTPALFLPNEATLIDKQATLTALGDCVGTVDPTTKITVQGHTAAVGGGDPQGAVDLSTQRATEVAALLQEVGVPGENITSVTGLGDSAPLVQPASDPGNRAVVVTFTTTG
ncbi:flagellar motor protein MotB [Nakamurella sp.]|uniref:flagellar motor protein MotB n=1 Tax=Nakamurella sp. TaxID=1869182 RepID=UPI0037837C41